MADTKISGLTALVGSTVSLDADCIPIVDTSITTTKKMLVQELFNSAVNLAAITNTQVSIDADSVLMLDASTVVTKKILARELGYAIRDGGMSPITNSLAADVNLNNASNYFDGPSVAQGTVGTWFASGTVAVYPGAGQTGNVEAKLWDGTTVIASSYVYLAASATGSLSVSGYLASPAGNLRISVRNTAGTSGKIVFNQTGNSKDSTITAIRIG